jgi:hypothetical protein
VWSPEGEGAVTDRVNSFTPPSLKGRHVYLRAVVPDDYTYLQLVETSSAVAPIWRLRGCTPSAQEWMQLSLSGALAQFVILANTSHVRVGLVSVFQDSLQDGHARLAALHFDPRGRSPLMIFGVGLFIEYVFRCWNFHKLYMHVPEYNYPSFASGLDRIFTLEGRLRRHYYLDGRMWDQLILAIYRDTWREHPKRFLRAERVESDSGRAV